MDSLRPHVEAPLRRRILAKAAKKDDFAEIGVVGQFESADRFELAATDLTPRLNTKRKPNQKKGAPAIIPMGNVMVVCSLGLGLA